MDTPKPTPGIWLLRSPDGKYYHGEGPMACLRAEQAQRVPADVAVRRIADELAAIAYPHHCAPDDVAALVQRMEALSDPEQEAVPSYENTDWRTLAGVAARVIKYLNGDDWRAGA